MSDTKSDMRSYIRHPVDVPISCQPSPSDSGEFSTARQSHLKDVSTGGLSFFSADALQVGRKVCIHIDVVKPPFDAEARVTWCHPEANGYLVGLVFVEPDVEYQARMVEQLCHIEHYRKTVARLEGRKLTPQEAAMEWIEKYASDFPRSL